MQIKTALRLLGFDRGVAETSPVRVFRRGAGGLEDCAAKPVAAPPSPCGQGRRPGQ